VSVFLNPTGRSTYGIAICGRCSKKFFLDELSADPNAPGLMVCRDDLDELDPYRLPMRPTEDVTLEFVRPDEPLDGTAPASAGDFAWYGVRLPWVIGGWL